MLPRRSFIFLLIFSSCSAQWHCGVSITTWVVSYGLALGDEEINDCCGRHDVTYDLLDLQDYMRPQLKWEYRKAADEEMLRCMTSKNQGIYRRFVSNTFYGACRTYNWFCETTNLC